MKQIDEGRNLISTVQGSMRLLTPEGDGNGRSNLIPLRRLLVSVRLRLPRVKASDGSGAGVSLATLVSDSWRVLSITVGGRLCRREENLDSAWSRAMSSVARGDVICAAFVAGAPLATRSAGSKGASIDTEVVIEAVDSKIPDDDETRLRPLLGMKLLVGAGEVSDGGASLQEVVLFRVEALVAGRD
jgi:hypothetical protein